MFGLGMGELIVLAVVALLVLGPDRLPKAARTLGQGIRGFRKQTRELQTMIDRDTDIGDAVRELKSALRDDPVPPRPWKPPTATPKADPPGGAETAQNSGSVGAPDDDDHSTEPDPDGNDTAVAGSSADKAPPVPAVVAASGSVARGADTELPGAEPADDPGKAQPG